MISINARLLLVHFFIMLNFMSFYVHVYVLYELFFGHNVVHALAFLRKHVCLSCVFYNKITYLLTWELSLSKTD